MAYLTSQTPRSIRSFDVQLCCYSVGSRRYVKGAPIQVIASSGPVPALYVVHREDLLPQDVTLHEDIPVVSASRAVLQCHAAGLGAELLEQAIEDGLREGVLSVSRVESLRREVGLAGAMR